ncbi:MAG: hypothetical protein ISS63_15625 [Desulfobacteraceae bacterium]|nr:hypothetical protein [Desulfobacteraceae bacterium]
MDPELDVIRQSAPFLQRIQLNRLNPRRLSRDILSSGTELVHLLKEIPGEIRKILRQTREGKIKIEFHHRGMEPLLSTFDRVSNRLAFAIVLASLLIGSSLIA